MPLDDKRPPAPKIPESAAETRRAESTALVDSSTSGGPTWYLDARPLRTCHDWQEWAIDCPDRCGAEALAWRSRPGRHGSGWACTCGARGPLWALLPRIAA